MNRLNLLLSLLIMAGCSTQKKESTMSNAPTDTLSSKLTTFSLRNKDGLNMTVTGFGGRIVSLFVPDSKGNLANIVLGYDSVGRYPKGNPYFGAMIGRYGNRIAKGKFTLDGNEYTLPINNGPNSLHGGPGGFHNVYWDVTPVVLEGGNGLEMKTLSKDGDAGYPGNLSVKVTYQLTDANELVIDYEATTDKATVVNLTHHSFFNLAGEGSGDILKHELTIVGDKFCPVDNGLIPTGELKPVKGTPFDFLTPHAIGERIEGADEQLKFGKGYDHNWVLNKKAGELSLAAKVVEPSSGRVMEVWTTEPGLQFYSGNFLDGSDSGPSKRPYGFRSAFCLEAQHFPDSPNHPEFPTTVLRPGEVYKQRTIYKFLTAK